MITPVQPSQTVVIDPLIVQRQLRSAPNWWRFCAISGQLGLLLAVFRLYHLEDIAFLRMSIIVCGAFLLHYWLPFRLKEPFLAAVSLGGTFVLLEPPVAALVIGIGLLIFLILRIPVAFRWRLISVIGLFAILIYGRATGALPVPTQFYAIFGGIFMFRIMVYLYYASHSKEPVRLIPFLNYFFLLPNYTFTFFPVIDFQTMRRTFYSRDIHLVAQQGIRWMVRGGIQLCLYRLVFYFNDQYLPDRVNTLGSLLSTMVLTYLLYLNVSGRFWVIIGMLHLFGYDLPETNRRYLLADSLNDYWRRINIYWKDFMVEMFYFPVYFKLRRRNDLQAQIVATAVVFVASWGLHAYQSFWIIGRSTIRWTDTVFWTILGIAIIANTLYDRSHKRKAPSGWRAHALHGVQIAAMFLFIITLWSMWSSLTFSSWFYLMTHWIGGGR